MCCQDRIQYWWGLWLHRLNWNGLKSYFGEKPKTMAPRISRFKNCLLFKTSKIRKYLQSQKLVRSHFFITLQYQKKSNQKFHQKTAELEKLCLSWLISSWGNCFTTTQALHICLGWTLFCVFKSEPNMLLLVPHKAKEDLDMSLFIFWSI